jgi:transposase-like protein
MVADLTACPFCHQTEPIIRSGTNQSGSARCRCKDCGKTFTPKSNSRKTPPEKEQQTERALQERLSIEATARLLRVAKKTIYKTLKKQTKPLEHGLIHLKRDALELDELCISKSSTFGALCEA